MASEGQAKVSLLLELKNRMSTALTRAKENVNGSVAHMKGKFKDLQMSHAAAFTAMKDEIPGLSNAMRLLGNPYVLLAAGAVALGGGALAIASFSSDWEKGMAKVNVTAQLSKKELTSLSDEVLKIGARNATPLSEVPEAFNRIISAGLDAKQALEALEPTLKAAKAGSTDTMTVAAAGVAVMKSSGENINKVYDVLFATLNKGNAEFKDIANYLPKLVPDARNLGFGLSEVAGAFAYMTSQGQTAEASTTLLQNTFKAFGDGKIRKNLENIGVAVFDDKGKARPFLSIIEDLSSSLTGLTDEQRIKKLEALGLDGEASRGLSAMVQNSKELRTTIDFTTNSAGQLDKAVANSKTSTDDWVIALNEAIVLFKPIGDGLMTAFGTAGTLVKEAIGFIAEYKTEIGIAIGAATAVWLGYNASIIGAGIVTAALTAKQWLLNVAMNANPIGLIVTAVAALVLYVGIAIKKYEDFGAAMLILLGPIGMVVSMIMSFAKHWNEITAAFKYGGMIEGIKKIGAVIVDALLYPIQQLLELISKIPGMGNIAGSGAAWIKDFRANTLGLNTSKDGVKKEESPFAAENTDDGTSPTSPTSPTTPTTPTNPANALADKATQSKNITINIDSFVKGGINTEHTNLQNMDESQLEQWMTNMFMRVVRNAEMNF